MSAVPTKSAAMPISSRILRPNLTILFAILVLFFVSGACGLLYQVVWTRKLVLLFGTTPYAVSTVLSIFFLGLGLGSWWGGRLADKSARPLFLYGVFEIIIGLWAVAFIFLISAGESVVVRILQSFALSHGMGILLRGVLALVFLIVPVTLMGATLPLLAKFVTAGRAVCGLRIGTLYGLNTLGAVTGCALTGFVLIENFGYARATFIGAAANVAIGLVALALARITSSDLSDKSDLSDRSDKSGSPATLALITAAFAISGFCFLALEVVWTRLLSIVFLGTTYAFTTMLTALLCGIGLGSLAAAAIADRTRHRVSFFGALQALMGIACIATLAAFAGLPDRFGAWQKDTGYNWDDMVRAKFALSFMALFIPTFLSGMSFPIAVKAVAASAATVGGRVGRLYSANTFGGVLGALAGGYLLIPRYGTHGSVLALAFILVGVGGVLVFACPTRSFSVKGVMLVIIAGLTAGAIHVAPSDVGRAVNQWYIPKDQSTIYYREGVAGTVVVSSPNDDDSGSNRVLWVNAVQATTSIEKGVMMNRFEGVLPIIFDRTPRTALFMCFGSGITAGTLGLSDFERIDAVEIAKPVLDAAPLFKVDNFDVLNNKKLNFIVDDGRNFLLTTKNKYDVITFEPMPLAIAGVSTFYTQEYYRLCLEHLTPGGVVSQWVPLHSLSPPLVRSLTRTFTSVFPEYTGWFVNSDLFLIGSNEPIRVSYDTMRIRLANPDIHAALDRVGLGDPIDFLNTFMMSKTALDAYTQDGAIMTDDQPWAEFEAPRLVYQQNVPQALKEVLAHFESPRSILDLDGIPEPEAQAIAQAIDKRHESHVHLYKGVQAYYEGPLSNPENQFKKALEIDPLDRAAQGYLADITLAKAKMQIRWDEKDEAIAALEEALRLAPVRPELWLALADIYADSTAPEKAPPLYRRFLESGGATLPGHDRAERALAAPAGTAAK
ncbi:MAG: fused MFS/spermidine synthase [Candidatus Hydrogenedentes bacterium]|nr:fused MFS/spermidine synthase [Candidatus Hydrogenedentota bacterium]